MSVNTCPSARKQEGKIIVMQRFAALSSVVEASVEPH
jgi:hypothetical protein